MEVEFRKAGILYKREKRFNIEYEGVSLPHKFDADFLVFDSIILEVKASWQFHPEFQANVELSQSVADQTRNLNKLRRT